MRKFLLACLFLVGCQQTHDRYVVRVYNCGFYNYGYQVCTVQYSDGCTGNLWTDQFGSTPRYTVTWCP